MPIPKDCVLFEVILFPLNYFFLWKYKLYIIINLIKFKYLKFKAKTVRLLKIHKFSLSF